jgi:chemotaxis protein MotB
MALSRRSRDSGMNYWPGFVDALSTLILSVIFLLTVFMVAQFFLSQEVAGKDTALARLNAQITRLSELLSLEQSGKTNLEEQIASLRSNLAAAEGERDRLRGLVDAGTKADAQNEENGKLTGQLDVQKQATARAVAQVEILNQQIAALRRQLAALEEALGASEKKDQQSQARIAELGQRLNVALAQRVQELSRYRSDFFGKLRDILGNRPDVRIVGDRFVFQSELFFDSGSANLRPEGRAQLDKLAAALLDLDKQIPSEINWFFGSTAIPTPGRPVRTRSSNRTGNSRRRARSRSCNI